MKTRKGTTFELLICDIDDVELDMPGWITFSIDGKYVYPSSGEVIDVKSRKIVATLQDEFSNSVESEKMVEIDFPVISLLRQVINSALVA